jgi:hypothetical protein
MSRIAILATVALALAGCRTDPNIPILERELRLQEDKIYELEAQLAESRAALEAARGEPSPARPGASGPERPAGEHRGPAKERAPAKDAPPMLPPGISSEPVIAQPPIVELPSGAPQSQMPDTLKMPKDGPPMRDELKPPRAGEPAPPAAPSKPAAPAAGRAWQKASPVGQSVEAIRPAGPQAGRVERVLLNPALTGGLNADGKPGDEGLAVFIEPQDGQGRSIARPGSVSVVVLDRQARGETARVARWDFTGEQVAQRMRRTSVGTGIYLELPWPAQPPAHSNLQVFVRYAADDARHFEAEMPIGIELPGQPRQWTAAPPGTRRPIAPAAAPSPPPALAAEPVKPAPARLEAAPVQTPPRDHNRAEARRPVWSPTR